MDSRDTSLYVKWFLQTLCFLLSHWIEQVSCPREQEELINLYPSEISTYYFRRPGPWHKRRKTSLGDFHYWLGQVPYSGHSLRLSLCLKTVDDCDILTQHKNSACLVGCACSVL